MKRPLMAKLFALLLVFCLSLPAAAFAEMTVKLTNKTTKIVSLCLRYKDQVSNEWVTRGWWNVDPLSVKNIKINTNNTIAYFYASAGKSWWGAKKGESGAVQHTIVNEKFLVKGDVRPKGKNPKNVWFRKSTAKNRVFSITLQGE